MTPVNVLNDQTSSKANILFETFLKHKLKAAKL